MVRSRETDCERLKRLHLYDDVFLHKFGGFPKWLSINLDLSLSVRLRLFFHDSQEKKSEKTVQLIVMRFAFSISNNQENNFGHTQYLSAFMKKC